MKYAELKSIDRFDTYADLTGTYSRGRYGQFKAAFRDYEMKDATVEIQKMITAFREKYAFVKHSVEWIDTDDNDEIGTGTSRMSFKYSEIGDECVFLVFEKKIVGVAYPNRSGMPVVWFHEESPGYHVHDDYAFYEK